MSTVAAKRGRSKAAQATPQAQAEWISTAEAVVLLGRGQRAPSRLASKGIIRKHKTRGLAPLYHKGDILALLPPSA